MTTDELHALFEKYSENEYIKFERVENKRSQRKDLHAFLLLDSLVPGTRDIVSAAEHDQFWIDVSPADLAAVATREIVLELVRCGVRYEEDTDSLAMFA